MVNSLPIDSKLNKSYTVIDLTILKDISQGDIRFEKEITEKFLILINEHIVDLKHHLNLGHIDKLKATAHYALSTIYVMGLNKLLERPLKMIEHQSLSQNELAIILRKVEDIMKMAKADATKFLKTII